jgi:hypothetical protein
MTVNTQFRPTELAQSQRMEEWFRWFRHVDEDIRNSFNKKGSVPIT